ncbi:glucose 1-dehydrogenase [Nocardioides sp.]|jgi:NAD(P)-dependent dehydrogenase (short-subunit alcohol dehydrogenase family)|uniref:SDR family NAD(P)-dependent oxidoreductase n=1 Tax=Nocardioides sp. TaxID=35761 RepID=UPI0031FE8EDE|nr:putative short-chain dehydrogenase/reductase family protein [Nocardioides sp.]
MEFDGKIAIVSAGGSGIGKHAALGLAAKGASVAVLDLNGESAEAVVAEILAAGGKATAHQGDASSLGDLDRAVAEIKQTADHVDILFNNVGMPNPHGIDDITDEQWTRCIDVNLKSNFFLTQKVLPLMRVTGRGGSIIYTASAAGLTGSYTTPLYSMTKSGLVGLTRSLAILLAPEKIRVNAICPGPVRTPMLAGFMSRSADATDEIADLYASRVPLGRVAEPSEIADAVIYLAGDTSSYVTGVPFPVDGGYTTQ